MSLIKTPLDSSFHSPSPIANQSTKVRDLNGRVKTVVEAKPLHQMDSKSHSTRFYTQNFSNTPTNLFQNSGQKFSVRLPNGCVKKILNAVLEIEVKNTDASNAQTLVPAPYFFTKIELKTADGSKDLSILHNDSMYFNMALIEGQRKNSVLTAANMTSDYGTNSTTLTSAANKTYYLPLVGSILNTAEIYFGNAKGDLVLELTPSSDLRSNSATGTNTIQCVNLNLILESRNMNSVDDKFHTDFFNKSVVSRRFLEPIQMSHLSETLTASTEKKLDLDSIVGDVSHIWFVIKSTTTGNSNDYTFSALGDDGTLDILDSGSSSLYGGGTALKTKFAVSSVANTHFPNDFSSLRNAYVISFADNASSSHHGVKSGFMKFDGNRKYLAIKPNSSFTSGSYNVYIYAYVHTNLSYYQGRYQTSLE